jgi:hypothetical protein
LNALFVQDPHGDETLAALARAINANTAAVQVNNARAAQEWERQRFADQMASEGSGKEGSRRPEEGRGAKGD